MTATTSAPITQRPVQPVKPQGLGRLTLRLTQARFQAKAGESLLYFAGILAYTVASALAFTVAGGTWMFWMRKQHPSPLHQQILAEDPTATFLLDIYVILAGIACALLLPSMISLASGAAVLGARGREERLASLRLLGLSSGDVVKMSLLDAMIQSLVGIVVGAVLYLLTLPLWGNLTMMAQRVEPGEMLLPWWLLLAVAAGVVLVGLVATVRGLRQVSISPLGVARRANKPRLSASRLAIFVGLLFGSLIAIQFTASDVTMAGVIVAGVIMALVLGIQVVAPWLLQVIARVTAHVPSPAIKWASRRIAADPRATWRRVAGVSLLCFIGGWMSLMPITLNSDTQADSAMGTFVASAQWDFSKGVMITLGVGFVLTATSLLISQASETIERGPQAQALRKMGAPARFNLRVMWLEVYVPLLLSVVLGTLLGMVPSIPMLSMQQQMGGEVEVSFGMIGTVIGGGLLITALALLATHPLYYRLLGEQQRRND